jgi:hypothetical protein
MSFEDLGFLFLGELDVYNSAVLFQIVLEGGREAAVASSQPRISAISNERSTVGGSLMIIVRI